MRAFLSVFRAHRKLYLTLLAIGTGPAIFGVFAPLVIALLIVGGSILTSVKQGRGTAADGSEKPLERLSRKELISSLREATNKTVAATQEIGRLQEQVESLTQIDADNELTQKVLQLVAAQLTAYDKSGGAINAEDTIEYLRGTLIALGEEFQSEQTAHFTAQDWEESLRDHQTFARARKHQSR